MWFSARHAAPPPPRADGLPGFVETIRRAAHRGEVLAQVQWGDILRDSAHVAPDPVLALQWYRIAAQAGYAPGHNMVGRCQHLGWGCPTDLHAAGVSFRTAAALGDLWGAYNLGILTMRGLGRSADLATAFALFRNAAERGHAKSMNLVARFTESGWATRPDAATARDWYRRSAEGGDYRGRHNYATILAEEGRVEDALGWWRLAVHDATSDILLAMRARLPLLGRQGDAALLARVEERLGRLPTIAGT